MSSTTPQKPQSGPNPHSKYFTHYWSITLPSHPGLKVIRGTPSHFPVRLALAKDPANNELQDSAGKVWDSAAIESWKERAQSRHESLNANMNGMDLLVELDGNIVGYGDIYEITPGTASVGIVLDRSARGKGVGRAGIQIFVQLGWELGLELVSGTMKANEPMRRVLKGLGVEEVEKVTEIPGRGVVAELDYTIERSKWKEVEMKIEFGEALVS